MPLSARSSSVSGTSFRNATLSVTDPVTTHTDTNGHLPMTINLSRRNFIGASASSMLALSIGRTSAQEPLKIATSMPILQDIVANITGDAAEVFSIMPANSDPHTWEPTPEDMVRISEADAFIFNGADLEPFVETGGWRGTVQDNNIPEFQVADHVEMIVVDEVIDHGDHVHELSGGDPHIWLDPLTIIQAIPALAEFLGELDADNAESFTTNSEAYITELEELDAELEETLGAIPEDRRKLLVFHDAWRYFAARYNFEVIGIVLENPNAEVSAQEMVHLLEVMEDHDVNVVFAEPQFNVSVLNLLEQEGDVEIVTLLTDSFAEGVESYADLMRFNRDQLVNALAD